VRVLKPNAISVHHFPGPNNLMEGHVNLPFPWLCHSPAYLRLCAWSRYLRGADSDWRHRANSYEEIMRFNNYPTKARLRRIARSVGAEVAFVEADEFLFRGGGRARDALRWLRLAKLDRLAARVAGLVLFQRYMVLKRRG
jgi:hypothetical protein